MKLIVQVTDDSLSVALAGRARRAADLRPLLATVGTIFVKGSKLRFDAGGDPPGSWPPTRRGGTILRDTGLFARSVHFRVLDERSVAVGSNRPGANIHQFGGTIRPVKAKALAIPLPGIKGRPREFEDTFVRSAKLDEDGGKGKRLGIIFQRIGPGKGQVRPLFVLMSSVDIPARPFVGYGEYERRWLPAAIRKHLSGD